MEFDDLFHVFGVVCVVVARRWRRRLINILDNADYGEEIRKAIRGRGKGGHSVIGDYKRKSGQSKASAKKCSLFIQTLLVVELNIYDAPMNE